MGPPHRRKLSSLLIEAKPSRIKRPCRQGSKGHICCHSRSIRPPSSNQRYHRSSSRIDAIAFLMVRDINDLRRKRFGLMEIGNEGSTTRLRLGEGARGEGGGGLLRGAKRRGYHAPSLIARVQVGPASHIKESRWGWRRVTIMCRPEEKSREVLTPG